MSEEKIHVTAHSGYRVEEVPREFVLGKRRVRVVEIQERWIEEGIGDRSTKRFFRVIGSDNRIHTIFYDEERQQWYLKP